MEKSYERIKFIITTFDVEDVITTSGGDPGSNPEDPIPVDGPDPGEVFGTDGALGNWYIG